jgi:hypothetical protein
MAQSLYLLADTTGYRQRAEAAFFATAERWSGVILSARAFAPAFPDRTRPDGSFSLSSISPVAIFATIMAAAIVSAGLFWPCGPFGIGFP